METHPLSFLIGTITGMVDEISAVLQLSSFDSKVLFVYSGLHYYKWRCFHGFLFSDRGCGGGRVNRTQRQQHRAPVSLFCSHVPPHVLPVAGKPQWERVHPSVRVVMRLVCVNVEISRHRQPTHPVKLGKTNLQRGATLKKCPKPTISMTSHRFQSRTMTWQGRFVRFVHHYYDMHQALIWHHKVPKHYFEIPRFLNHNYDMTKYSKHNYDITKFPKHYYAFTRFPYHYYDITRFTHQYHEIIRFPRNVYDIAMAARLY